MRSGWVSLLRLVSSFNVESLFWLCSVYQVVAEGAEHLSHLQGSRSAA